MSLVLRDRFYYKYGEDKRMVNLADSNNATYINSNGTFTVESVTAWSTTQIYNFKNIIREKHFRLNFPTGWIQSNAGWTVTITGITLSGQEINFLTKDWGYNGIPSGDFYVDLEDYIDLAGLKVYVYCYRRSTSYCYGSIYFRFFIRDRIPINLSGEDIYEDWKQPILTNNNSSFPNFYVYASSELSGDYPTWRAFDGLANNGWISESGTAPSEAVPDYLYFVTNNPLKIESIQFTNRTDTYVHPITAGTLQASIDGVDWVDIVPINNDVLTSGGIWNLTVNETIGYRYHRIKITGCELAGDSSLYVAIGEITITAKELKAIGGSVEDADFSKLTYKAYKFLSSQRIYYKYNTEPNANIVGSFGTIKDKIVKGTSTANYLTIPQEFAPGDNTWEVVYKCNINSYTGSATRIQGTTVDFRFAHIVLNTNGTIQWVLTSNGSSWDLGNATSTSVVPLKTDVWIKQEFTGSVYILSCSLDGKNFERYISIASTGKVYAGTISLGILAYTTGVAGLDGIFDLSQSYIKIREDITWSGDTYNKVGSWVDCDKGLAGKFTTANYLKLKGLFEPLSYDWEWTFKFTMGSDPTTTFYTFGCTNTSGYHGALLGMVSGKLRCWLSSNGTSWNIVSDGTAATALNAGQTYYVKFGWNGTEYYIDLSEDGVEYKRDYTLASTTAIHYAEFNIGNAWGLTVPFSGTIDFNESYIKINGKEWWHGTKAVEIPASEIDNWGTTRYFKNVVTTKYWKEITTGDEYACYTLTFEGNKVYWYAKKPVGSDMTRYSHQMGAVNRVTNISDLLVDNTWVWKTVTETSAILVDGSTTYTFTRYLDGDLTNKTTTVVEGTPEDYTYTTEEITPVEVTADDDYDYTESTPSDDFDYYINQIKKYNLEYKPFRTITQTFSASDELQIYTVPEGVTKLNINCTASRGYGTNGGLGGSVKCDLSVTPGQVLYVMVGKSPTAVNTAVYNASDIRIGGVEYENRIIIAGGGGNGVSARGGAGGGLVGQDAVGVGYQAGAFGGTQEAGGGASYRSGGNTDGWLAGSAGSLGIGGKGGYGTMYGGTVRGGAGGAGYYGGGGGGVYDINKVGITYAGGGGGSSYTDDTICNNVRHFQGVNTGEGYIKISYTKELR